MSELTSNSSDPLLKHEALLELAPEADRNGEEYKDPKRTRINPRAVLESLEEWRIQPDTIVFNPGGTRGEGASGDVERATLRRTPLNRGKSLDDTRAVAVKKFRLADNIDSERVLASMVHEITFMRRTNNPKIIEFVGFAENLAENIAWIILPWEANGNVKQFLDSKGWAIPELMSLIYDVSCGIQCLHRSNPPIRHGDLKPANILVNSQNRAVITDFGSARFLEEVTELKTTPAEPLPVEPTLNTTAPRVEASSTGTLITLTGSAWTVRWAAPELVDDTHPGLWSDIWAFAWICWEIMTGNMPFANEPSNNNILFQLAMRNFELPSLVTHQQLSQLQVLCGLMNKCWSLNVDERPTADECVSEIKRMDRITPSRKHGEGIRNTTSVELLLTLGHLDLKNGKLDEAVKYFDKALDVARSQDSPQEEGGLRTLERLREEQASGSAEVTHPKPEAFGPRSSAAHVTAKPGPPQRLQSEYNRIESSYIKAKGAYNRMGNQTGTAGTALRLGEVQLLRNDYVGAEASYREARKIYMQIEDKDGVAKASNRIGEIRLRWQDAVQAQVLYSEARTIYDRAGDQLGIANVSLGMGQALVLQRRYPEAETSYTMAREIYNKIGDSLGVAHAIRGLGEVQHFQGHYHEATASYIEARDIYNRIRDHLGSANATLGMGDIQHLLHEHTEAEGSYTEARVVYSQIGHQLGVANANRGLGGVQHLQRRYFTVRPCLPTPRPERSTLGLGIRPALQGPHWEWGI